MFSELIAETRTVRRFDRSKLITCEELEKIIENVRFTASAGNLQRIRYMTVVGKEADEAFSHVALGGYLLKEKKPTQDVSAVAYIVLMTATDTPDANLLIDIGISAEAIVLSAAERKIASCMIRNFKSEYFSSLCNTPGYYPALVIALGYAAESVKIVDAKSGDNLKYYKDDNDINCVPKLSLSELIIV